MRHVHAEAAKNIRIVTDDKEDFQVSLCEVDAYNEVMLNKEGRLRSRPALFFLKKRI